MTSIHTHEVRAKDSERQALAAQLSAFLAAGGIPEIVKTPARQEKMSLSQRERTEMTFENSRHEKA